MGIVGKLDTEKTGFALQSKLIDLACDLRSGNGAVSRRKAQLRAGLQTRSISQHSSDQTGAGKSAGSRSREASVERVVIEEGSRQATFVLSTDRAEALFLEIVAPQGDLVQPSDQVHVVKRRLVHALSDR